MTTAMYTATLGDQGVIVKFTPRYNAEAHFLLAKAGLALTLHLCERVIGDLYMVVMDHVDEKSIWQLQMDEAPDPAIILEKVEKALNLLHEQDIVLGDLQGPNILVASMDRVFLVDFDWAGKDGKARYPPTLNPNNTWTEEVVPYGIMHKARDLWPLGQPSL